MLLQGWFSWLFRLFRVHTLNYHICKSFARTLGGVRLNGAIRTTEFMIDEKHARGFVHTASEVSLADEKVSRAPKSGLIVLICTRKLSQTLPEIDSTCNFLIVRLPQHGSRYRH